MRRCLSIILLLLSATMLMARGTDRVKYPGGKCYLFRVTLTDKRGTPFMTDRPEEFLSTRAIERRRRQHLPIDSTDLPLNPRYVTSIAAEGVEVVSKSKWNNTLLVFTKKQDVMKEVSKFPFVKDVRRVWVSPDSIERKRPRTNYHTEFNKWDNIDNNPDGVTYEQLEMLGGNRLHRHGYRGKGMVIAVLDGGFMNADVIPAITKVRQLGFADFTLPVNQESIFHGIDHGTMVLSTMAANEPGMFMGTAPDAAYWLLRCEDTQTETMAEEDYWAAAVEFADSAGVDIINSSLGYHHFDDPSQNYDYCQLDGLSAMISRTASMLARKGIILVNSAGNDGMGPWKKINVPADAMDIITVGAVSANGNNAAFSSIGPTADGRVKPDVMAMGSPTSVITGRGVISKDIGTSFSAPLVAGMIACLWQAFPDKTALEIMEMVRNGGSRANCPDNIYGYGIPDFWSIYNKETRKGD